jgi:hypothetical protein
MCLIALISWSITHVKFAIVIHDCNSSWPKCHACCLITYEQNY